MIFCNLISNLRILLQITKFYLQIQLNPSKKNIIFACFWTVSALITLKNHKNFRALRAHGFLAFYKCAHHFLQISGPFSAICTFLSANVVFSKILVYKFSGFVYKFSAFVCKFFCKFKGGANYLDLYGTIKWLKHLEMEFEAENFHF